MKRLALLAFIWGWSFLLIKVSVDGMTPTTVAASRIGLGAVVLVVVCRVRRIAVPTDLATVRHYLVTACFGSALPFSLLAWGEERITSALTSVVNASTPLFTAAIGAVVLAERLRPRQVWGLALGFVGVGVAAGVGGGDLTDSSLPGVLAATAAGACYGFSFTYIKRHLQGVRPEAAAAGQLVVGTLVLGPVALATTATEGIDLDAHRLLAIGLLGTVGTGVAYVIYYRIIADLGPTRASLVTYLVPVVAVTVGVAFLDEPFAFRLVVGGALVVLGVAAVHSATLFRRRAPAPAPG